MQRVLGADATTDGSHILLSVRITDQPVALAIPFEEFGALLAVLSTAGSVARTARQPGDPRRHTLPVEAVEVRPEVDGKGVILDCALPGGAESHLALADGLRHRLTVALVSSHPVAAPTPPRMSSSPVQIARPIQAAIEEDRFHFA